MYDVIIVGGGPAGSSAGRAAARLGLRTLLLEKECFPRYKPCGGGLSARAISYLDFDLPRGIEQGELLGARAHYGRRTAEAVQARPMALLIPRSLLDDALLAKAGEAGAEVRQGEKVTSIEERAEDVLLRTPRGQYCARFALIAEGAHGRLKTLVRQPDTRSEEGFCVVAEADPPASGVRPGVAEVHLGFTRWGYGWVFPYREYCSVGIGGLIAAMPRPKETMREFLRANGFDEGCRLRGHKLPVGGLRRTLMKGRLLLCGDAAGLVDPFSGEGMAYAIRSGQLAARAIHEAANDPHGLGALQGYVDTCERELCPNLRDALRFSRLVYRFPDLLFRALTSNARVMQAYLEVISGESSYRSFLGWVIPRLPVLSLAGSGGQSSAGDTD